MTSAVKGHVGGKLVWLLIVEVNGNCEGIDVELAWLLVGLVLLLFCVDDCEEIVDKCEEEVSPYAVDWLEAKYYSHYFQVMVDVVLWLYFFLSFCNCFGIW